MLRSVISKLASCKRRLGNRIRIVGRKYPKVFFSSLVLVYFVFSLILSIVVQIAPPKSYYDNPTFPYTEKVSEGVAELKNYDPIKQTLAAPKADLNLKQNNSGSFKWKVMLLSGTNFLFGKQTEEGILPKVRIVNKEGYFVEYSPRDFKGFVSPKVSGNVVEWKIGEGLVARYTMQQDRVKADYIASTKDALSNTDLQFDISSGNEKDEKLGLKDEKMPGGDIDWITNDVGAISTIFTFPTPEIIDAEKEKFEGSYSLTRQKTGQSLLSIILPKDKVENAAFPLTIDPVTVDSSATATATAYGNGRKILRDQYGNLIVVIAGESTTDEIYYKNHTSTSWVDAGVTLVGVTQVGGIATDIDSSGDLHSVFHPFGGTNNNGMKYAKISITRNSSNEITSMPSAPNSLYIDQTFGAAGNPRVRRPSLIVANKGGGSGVEKVAVVWAVNSQSGDASTRGEIRFMQCDVADDCTIDDNWKNASEEINGSGGTATCSDSATSGDAGIPNALNCKGTSDVLFSIASHTTHHAVLTQMPGRPKRSPASVKKYHSSAYTTLSNTIDNNTGTTDDVSSITTTSYIYVGDDKPFSKTSFDITNTNSSNNLTAFEYWNGGSWTALSNVYDYTLINNCGIACNSLNEDGSIIFDEPSDWATTAVDSVTKYWVRYQPGALLDSSISIAEVYVTDRNSKALLVVTGLDSTDDLRAAYAIWDEVANDKWENVHTTTAGSDPGAGRPWRFDSGGASSALDDVGGNWAAYTNYPLTGTVDYLNNRVYIAYACEDDIGVGCSVGGDRLIVKSAPNNRAPTVTVNWTDTDFPTVTEGLDIVSSLTSDGSDIYMFYVLDPLTNSLVYRKCSPGGAGNGNYCDNASDWGSELTIDSATDRTHPQAVMSKMPGDTTAIDLIYTQDTATDTVQYERHYVNNQDKTITVSASTDNATHWDCEDGAPMGDTQSTATVWVGVDVDSTSCDDGGTPIHDGILHSGFRFLNVTAAQGSVISSAYLDLRVNTVVGGDLSFTIYGDDSNDTSAFSTTNCPSGTECINDRTKTTSNNVHSGIAFKTNTYRFDVTKIIQEIVCRGASNAQPCVGDFNGSGSWASGNDLSLLLISGESVGFSDKYIVFDNFSNTFKPTLQINLANATTGKSYSKGVQFPHTGPTDLTNLDHPLSNIEFGAVGTDDTNYASISAELNPTASTSAVPMFMFKVNNSNNSNTYKIDATAKFKTSIPTSSKTMRMQIYRGGSTDNWVDVDTDTATAADTEFALDMSEISTSTSDYYFNETPGIGTQYVECTDATANCWTYWRIWQEPQGTSGTNQILYADYFNVTYAPAGPDKVAFSNASRTLTANACNGAALVFTMELQSGTTPTNPISTTVVRVTSNSSNYIIYSDATCSTAESPADFTYTTSQNTKSVYIVDNKKSITTRTLTGTRQSGDTLTTGTQDYTVNAGSVTRLVITLPGQTFTDSSGNSGTVLNQASGAPFNIQLNATDSYFNLNTSYTGDKTLVFAGPSVGSSTPTVRDKNSVNQNYGTNTIITFSSGNAANVSTTLYKQETTTITATDGGSYGYASASLTIDVPRTSIRGGTKIQGGTRF